jgi:hypothetical protein
MVTLDPLGPGSFNVNAAIALWRWGFAPAGWATYTIIYWY